jgi:hypothetical protein
MITPEQREVVIMGASLAGLLAQTMIIEREVVPMAHCAQSVSQGRQPHVLLHQG